MRRTALSALAGLLAGTLVAQSNTVPGLDGRLTDISGFMVNGHTATTIGCAAQNDMCNPGTVNIPWFDAGFSGQMREDHPKFGFLVCRESNGRFEQVSDRSFCKHAFISINGGGSCGSCQPTGSLGGQVMGVHCADAYGAVNNADPAWLGPADEIDPWLGTWNRVGSYFDRGDPDVGPPQNADGVRSLSTSQLAAFNAVKNRVTINISDLGVAGASYCYQIHLLHQGEALANRADNMMSRGVTFSGSGTNWTAADSGLASYGSILTRWTGATVTSNGNGTDDGRFFVAVKVTGPVAGMYHYEYAVHNADNSRGGAAFHVPVDPSATVTNLGFRDIDGNALNDWTAARVGNEVIWSAPAGNPLNWNTVYNFWFDCSNAPVSSFLFIDEARIGPGLLDVPVASQGPTSTQPPAAVTAVGSPCAQCPSTVYELFASPGAFDLANNSMTFTLNGGSYTLGPGTGTFVAPTGAALPVGNNSTFNRALPFTLPYPGGSTTVLFIYTNGFVAPVAGNDAAAAPRLPDFLSGPPRWAAAWHDFDTTAGGTIQFDSSPTAVLVTWTNVANFNAPGASTFQYQFFPNGTVNILWQAMAPANTTGVLVGWTPGNNAIDPGSRDLSATLPLPLPMCAVPFRGLQLGSSARPVLGTTIALTTSNIPAGSPFAALVLSSTQAVPPQDLASIGMPGCFAHLVGGVSFLYVAPGASAATSCAVPANPSFLGVQVVGQSFSVSPPLTPLGVIASNGLRLLLSGL